MPLCINCGTDNFDGSAFCVNCGQRIQAAAGAVSYQYSPRIDSPEVLSYKSKSKFFAKIFLVIFAAGLLIFLLILSAVAKTISIQNALLIYAVIMAVTLLLSFFQLKNQGTTWDGVITEKRIVKSVNRHDDGDTCYDEVIYTPTLFIDIQKARKVLVPLPNTEVYNYFAVGEQVRKHKGFAYPEKLVKQSPFIHCLNCGRLFEKQLDHCPSCKMPAIK
jgi:hypothetical protein